jgi:hypothetical protein
MNGGASSCLYRAPGFPPSFSCFLLCRQNPIIVRLGLTNTPDEVHSPLPNYPLSDILPRRFLPNRRSYNVSQPRTLVHER